MMFFQWLFVNTLRRRLSIFVIVLVIGAVSAVGIASVRIAQQVISDHTARFGGKMLTQAAYRLGSVIDNAETTVDSLILDRRLAPALRDLSAKDGRRQENARADLRELLIQYRASILPGAEFILIDGAGNMVTTYAASSPVAEIVTTALPAKPKVWQLRYLPNLRGNDAAVSGRLLELTARIISLPGQPQSGWIILHMDYRIVESIMTNISLQEEALSRFQSDAVVYGPEKQVIFPWVAPTDRVLDGAYQKLSGRLRSTETIEQRIAGRQYLIIGAAVPWTPWEVYIAAPASRLYTGLTQIYDSILMIGLLCALGAVFCAGLLSFFVTKPVDRLRRAMALVEEGDFSAKAPEVGPQEIQALGRAFNRMLGEVDNLTRRLVAEESDRKTAMIQALQAQIAPHFLFNTLAAMAGMTAKRPPEEVAEALRSLKRLLYLSIGQQGDFVPLAAEFEHIHHYIYLMGIRYPGKFELRLDLPEELNGCRTIRLILQPIVENSVQHGLKTRGGLIQVSAMREGNDGIIKVIDDGQGMSPEQLNAAWRQSRKRPGVGIRNVDERLKLSFGPGYGLTLASVKGCGTTASIRIPLLFGDGEEIAASGEFPPKEQA